MGRPSGARNRAYDNRRSELLKPILAAVVAGRGQVSLRDLSRASSASIPTLKHYFGDGSGAVAAALRTVRDNAAIYIETLARPGRLGLAASLTKVGRELSTAWVRHGVGALFTSGLCAGLADEQAGPGYLDGVLEPTLQALEERLRVHAGRGELQLEAGDELGIRTAAMAFLSPLLVALLHQHGLLGSRCRPLAIDDFLALHIAHYLKAYGVKRRRRARKRSLRGRPSAGARARAESL